MKSSFITMKDGLVDHILEIHRKEPLVLICSIAGLRACFGVKESMIEKRLSLVSATILATVLNKILCQKRPPLWIGVLGDLGNKP